MGQIEWAMWANEQGVLSASILLLGGIVGIVGMFDKWQFGVCAVIVGLLVLLMEWPRGKRSKGSTIERLFQRPFTILIDRLGVVGRNYFFRFVAYLILCVPCCFIISTLMGGVCLLVTSIIYFTAAIKGEEWKPSGIDPTKRSSKKRARSLHPPRKPPPRDRSQSQLDEGSTQEGASVENIAMEIEEDTNVHQRDGPKVPSRPPPRPRTAAIHDPIQ